MRRPSQSPRRLAIALCVGLLATLAQGAKSAAPNRDHQGPQDAFIGMLVPLNATDLYGPETGFRVSGWDSCCGPVKILELKADGAMVKKGELIARLEFRGKDAESWLTDKLHRAQADQAQARITTEETVQTLRADTRRLALDAQLASLDVQKERALSKRQAELYKILQRIAAFEAESVDGRLDAAVRSRNAELAYQDQMVARAEQDLGRYKFYEDRMLVRAPHDGVVRLAYNARESRRMQKADSLNAGQKLASVAKDETLAVRFFVPEHRIAEVKVGTQILALGASSGEELHAKVTGIDFFPQELGFLREQPNLPDAREKAFAVTAEFDRQPQGVTTGAELHVKVQKP